MGWEKALLVNLSEVLNIFMKTNPGVIIFVGSVNKYPNEIKFVGKVAKDKGRSIGFANAKILPRHL